MIGGGVVGMEFASLYAELGSQVTVLEMLPRILPMVEADISNLYRRHLEKLGGKIHTEAKVEGVVKDGRGFKVRFGIGGEGAETGAEVVLLAAGRTPYTDGLGLDAAGVELDGHAGLTGGRNPLVEKVKSTVRLRDYDERGDDPNLGLPDDLAGRAPVIDTFMQEYSKQMTDSELVKKSPVIQKALTRQDIGAIMSL